MRMQRHAHVLQLWRMVSLSMRWVHSIDVHAPSACTFDPVWGRACIEEGARRQVKVKAGVVH